jgi:hypothetical protein
MKDTSNPYFLIMIREAMMEVGSASLAKNGYGRKRVKEKS